MFAKNLSPLNINESTSNNRSAFTISNRQVRTNFIKYYNIVISTTNYTNDTDLPSDFLSYFLNAFDYESAYDKPIRYGVFESPQSSETYINMSIQPQVQGNSIAFHAQFQSPTVAGTQMIATGFGDLAHKKVNVNYTDTNGQVEEYKIHYAHSISSFTAGNYPVINSFNRVFGNVTRVVYLNPDEVLAETGVIDIQSDNEDLLIYNSVAKNNSLHKQLSAGLSLTAYLYTDDTSLKYTIDTKGVIAGYSSTASVTVNKTTGEIQVGTATVGRYAIADSNDNLYIVQRKANLTKLYVNTLETNPNLGG